MGSIIFRNRYWFYKSLYDDYIGRDFKLALGISSLLWMPHYWYIILNPGSEFPSTEPSKSTTLTKTISWSSTHAETDSATTFSSSNSKWFSRIGSNCSKNMTKVPLCIFRRRKSCPQMIYHQYLQSFSPLSIPKSYL